MNVSPAVCISLKCIAQQGSVCVRLNTISMQMINKQTLSDGNVTVLVSVAKTGISICCRSVNVPFLTRRSSRQISMGNVLAMKLKMQPITLFDLPSSVCTAMIMFPMAAVLCLDLECPQ